MRYIIYGLIAVIIIYFLLEILKPKNIKTSSRNDIKNSIKSFDKISYLGENPNADLTDIKEGTLHIYKDIIVFDDGKSELFTLPIRNINKCLLESKHEKNKTFVRIKLDDSQSIILKSYFNIDYSSLIVEEINIRMKYKN